jgi:hypothetical protein
MTRHFKTRDGRLTARVILLAHRFGCAYTDLTVTSESEIFSVAISLTGPEFALRRLDAQIGKLLEYEKETV